MGRLRKPTNILRMEGNKAKSGRAAIKAREAKEPKAPMGKGDPPKWLKGGARRMFRRLHKILDSMGVMSAADEDGLAMLCQHQTLAIECWETAREAKGAVSFSRRSHLTNWVTP